MAVRFRRHRMDAGGVDPTVVEVEESTNGDGEIDRLIAPAVLVQQENIFGIDRRRMVVDLLHKAEKSLLLFRKRAILQILQDTRYQFFASQQFRRNCGVILRSKQAVVA